MRCCAWRFAAIRACEYTSSVHRLLAWCINSWTTFTFSPLATSSVEKVCKVCHPILFANSGSQS